MATLMQKDAMIEILAGTRAHVFRFEDKHGETKETREAMKQLAERRSSVYSTSPEDIDYPEFLAFKTQLKEQFPE